MDQEKTYKWIQDRLRELNAGTIAAADFHALESLAKDNPFVADALEGYQLHPDLDHTEYLDSLAQKIKPYKRERRRWLIPNLTVTAIAASLILIIGFYAVMTRMSPKEDPGLATATEERILSIENSGDTMMIVDNHDNGIASAEQAQPSTMVEEPPMTMRQSVSKSASRKENKNEKANTETTRNQPTDEVFDIDDAKSVTMSSPSGVGSSQEKEAVLTAKPLYKMDASYYANQMNPQIMVQRVTGRVTSITGDPLIGVNLFVSGTNLGTTSQSDGKFELYLPDGEAEVAVVYGGYENAELTLKPGDEDVVIPLKEITLQDVNSVMAGSTKRVDHAKSASPKMSTVKVFADEQLLFIDYLKTNSKYPLAENLNVPAKTVLLEFSINSESHPTQIKIITSSGIKNLDDEAVRLIKKGPDWECAGLQYPCKVRYSIYFKT